MTTGRVINYAALPALLVATWLGWNWLWGLMFLWWLVPSVLYGEAFLVNEVKREEDPALFWFVVILWALFGCMMVAADLFPDYAQWLT